MAVTAVSRDQAANVTIVRWNDSATLATVAAADYVTSQYDNLKALNSGVWEWLESDLIAVYASDGHQLFEFDGDDFTSFIQLPGGNGEVTLPVVDGDFTVFDGTLGALKDLGFSASDPAKTKVVMAGSSVTSGNIAHFVDTSGTIDDTAGAVSNQGSIYAGASAVAGVLRSYPSAATTGYLGLTGVANAGDYAIQISNASHGQATVYSIPDVGASTGQFLVKTAALVSGNFPLASGTAGKIVDSGYNVDNILLVASVAMTAAEWNGMYAAPKLLIAAPGANKLIVIDRAECIMTYVSANYAAGGVVGFQYDSTVHGAGVAASNTQAAADFQAAASTTFMFNGVAGNTVAIAPFSTTVNKGLYLSNLTGAFTTGDSTWVIKVHYRIVATA